MIDPKAPKVIYSSTLVHGGPCGRARVHVARILFTRPELRLRKAAPQREVLDGAKNPLSHILLEPYLAMSAGQTPLLLQMSFSNP